METFTFGKYKSQSVDSVIKFDPSYVLWASKNVSFFNPSEGQIDECKKLIRKTRLSFFDRMAMLERSAGDFDEEDDCSEFWDECFGNF